MKLLTDIVGKLAEWYTSSKPTSCMEYSAEYGTDWQTNQWQ